jgi:hypothetical protein
MVLKRCSALLTPQPNYYTCSIIMASLSQDAVSKTYRIHFRYGGKQFQKSLKTSHRRDAEARRGCISQTLEDIERGRLIVPPDADIWEFIKSDGKRDQKTVLPAVSTLGGLFDWYFSQQLPGGKEANTLTTERIHAKHFQRLLGAKTTLEHFQLPSWGMYPACRM